MPVFEVNRLSQDELIYELRYRGFNEVDTVERMRKCLRNLLSHEKCSERSFSYPPYNVPPEVEEKEIGEKIAEITALVVEFENDQETSLRKKLETKFAHILGRVDRLSTTDSNVSKIRSNFLQKIITLESDFEEMKSKVTVVTDDKLTDAAVHFEQELLETSGENSRFRSEIQPATPPHSSSPVARSFNSDLKLKTVPVSQWNLKFSGEKGCLSVSAFLERVDELCISRNFPKERLIDFAIDLFTGRALVWYRAIRSSVDSWSALANQLREEFQPFNYEFLLWEEIKRRTQGSDETIGLYIAVMENLFKRLRSPVSDNAKLAILLRNLNPFYSEKLGLTEIDSVDQLLRLGRNLEARRSMISSYHPPSRRKTDLEPDLAYIETAPCSSVGSSITCWNCKQTGHIASKCPIRKSKKCFKCGKEGYTVRTCPDCNKKNSEN